MRIAVCGNLNNNAYRHVKFLRRRGVEADLLLSQREERHSNPEWEDPEIKGSWPDWIRRWRPSFRVADVGAFLRSVNILREYDLIHAYTVTSAYAQFAGRPFVAHPTGADLTELAPSQTTKGWLLRRAFRKASCICFHNFHHLDYLGPYRRRPVLFVPPPLDTDRYTPPVIRPSREELVIFHPSRLSWTTGAVNRKDNHLLFQAVAQLLREGHALKLEVVDWGVDAPRARSLCAELDIADHVEFLAPMSKPSLIARYQAADMVVEQFFMGTASKVFFEAMACGTPVISYIPKRFLAELYAEAPPFLNAHTQEEVTAAIRQALDPAVRAQLGRAARARFEKYHNWETFAERMQALYAGLLKPASHDTRL